MTDIPKTISRRDDIAKMVMRELLRFGRPRTFADYAKDSVSMADALIAELDKK